MNHFIQKQPEKVDLKKVIEDKIKEYESAIVYFQKNEYKEEQIKKGEEDKKKLIDLLEKIKLGETVDENLIPKEITPEYINGYSNDERIKKYYEIIIKIIEEKKKLKDELEKEIKELKKLNENELLDMEKEVVEEFQKIKSKKEKYDEIINILKEDFQNKWIPAPLFLEKEEEVNLEIINEEIPENTLVIEFKKTDYEKNKQLCITAELNGTDKKETWDQKAIKDWSHTIKWELNKEEYDDISKKVLYFQVNEKLKGNKVRMKADGEIKLNKLEKHNEFSGDFEFKLKSKRLVPHVKVNFKIRRCIKPNYESVTKRIFCFTKFYPPFKK